MRTDFRTIAPTFFTAAGFHDLGNVKNDAQKTGSASETRVNNALAIPEDIVEGVVPDKVAYHLTQAAIDVGLLAQRVKDGGGGVIGAGAVAFFTAPALFLVGAVKGILADLLDLVLTVPRVIKDAFDIGKSGA